MSTQLGTVKSTRSEDRVSDRLTLSRFWGGMERGMCVQVTVGGEFVQLDRKGVKKLRKLLKNWDQV